MGRIDVQEKPVGIKIKLSIFVRVYLILAFSFGTLLLTKNLEDLSLPVISNRFNNPINHSVGNMKVFIAV